MASGEWRVASGETERPVRSYRDLKVWRKAIDFSLSVYSATRPWPAEERFGLTSQVRRASVSVASNIAEGAARRTTGEFRQAIGYARGSLAEAETQLLIAQGLGLLNQAATTDLVQQADEISRMLAGLISSLEEKR